MLTVTVLTAKNISAVAEYYEGGKDDYYSKEGGDKEWQGKGADFFDLSGDVDKGVFKSMLAGKLPDGTLMARTQRLDSKTRIGIDFTFQAPKSVSLQALVAMDQSIIAAHDKAVSAAVKELEQRVKARQKIDGKSHTQNTANLIIAKFRHETNREKEPHLHTHAVAINATRRDDGKWCALVNDELIKNPKYYDLLYKSVLAKELESCGYKLSHTKDSFELAHISRKQIEGMSSRLVQIDEYLASRGVTRETSTAEQRDLAAMQTRKKKEYGIDRDELHSFWLKKSKELGINYESREWNNEGLIKGKKEDVSSSLINVSKEEMAKRAVNFAINHHTERQTIVTELELKATAITQSLGNALPEDIQKEIDSLSQKGKLITGEVLYKSSTDQNVSLSRNGWVAEIEKLGRTKKEAILAVEKGILTGRLVSTGRRFTTQKALEQERKILSSELKGRDQAKPILTHEETKRFLDTTTLRKDQREASELILCTPNRIIGVQGQAGVGKSYTSVSVVGRIEQEGYKVHVLAPYGSQVKSLQKDGLTQAKTVASFLHTLSREHSLNEKTVIYVDEAGVLPNRLMAKLCEISERTGARLVLLGDVEQTKAVEAGIPFGLLQRNGMETALMNAIQRQKDNPTLLKAVELAAVGKSLESLELITQVIEDKDADKRYANIANEYVSLDKKTREDTLVLTGTNKSREIINSLIRDGLKIENEIKVTTLSRYDTTQAERRFSRNYNVGTTAIKPDKDYPNVGLVRGETYIVRGQGEGNTLILESEDKKNIVINPAHHKHLSVYKLATQDYGVGDKLVITRNNAELDIANGDRVTVKEVKNGKLYLEDSDRREIVFDASKKLHLDYAYVSTVHSAQGLTSSRVIANIEAQSKTVSKDWYYVAISRAKHSVKVYTENLKQLPASVARASTKQAAMDLEHKAMERTQEKSKGYIKNNGHDYER